MIYRCMTLQTAQAALEYQGTEGLHVMFLITPLSHVESFIVLRH